jgi:hypothetical protein
VARISLSVSPSSKCVQPPRGRAQRTSAIQSRGRRLRSAGSLGGGARGPNEQCPHLARRWRAPAGGFPAGSTE